jgi:hypothetical protein
VKSIKNIPVLIVALLYCFAMGMAGNNAFAYERTQVESSDPYTESGVSKASFNLLYSATQPQLSKIIVKASQPHHFKIPFTGLPVAAQAFNIAYLHSLLNRAKSFFYSPGVFSSTDIIYPFHSFW